MTPEGMIFIACTIPLMCIYYWLHQLIERANRRYLAASIRPRVITFPRFITVA